MLKYLEINSKRKKIIGVCDTCEKAWEVFRQKLHIKSSPYSGGTFHFTNVAMFSDAMHKRKSGLGDIKIYSHPAFEIYIVNSDKTRHKKKTSSIPSQAENNVIVNSKRN